MKRIVLVAAICFLPHLSFAQTPQNSYIGVYIDVTHSSWCVTQSPPYTVDLWFWAKPGINGFQGATFDIDYGGVTLDGDRVYHPNIRITPTKCKPPCPNFSKGYEDCQSDWVWLFHRSILVTSTDPDLVRIYPFASEYDYVVAWNCEMLAEPAVVLANVFINSCGPLPVESTTWGAIKSLYK